MRPHLLALALLPGCAAVAWDTTVATTPATRAAMVQSVRIGETTEGAMAARWGNPFQKIHEGAQTEYVYRRLNGEDTAYVIVTFRHGLATAVRTSDDEGCRGTFAPRVPGYGFDTAEVVWPVGACGPGAELARTGGIRVRDENGIFGTGLFPRPEAEGAVGAGGPGGTGSGGGGETGRPGVTPDVYTGDGSTK
ncbi:MAG: hypothetical protein AAFQ79_04160 [Pseudomonadota bacterium]